jgi:hypothetical protein
MRWTTTDPRSAGLADKVGATINYVSSGDEYVTLVKVNATDTDWAAVDAVLPASPMDSSRCPFVVADPRTGGRKGGKNEVVFYYAAGEGIYLIKYGDGDTDWVKMPTAADVGPHTHPIGDIEPGAEGYIATVVGGVAVWAAATSSSSWDSIFSGGQDGAINFNGGAVSVATGPVANVYTLTQNVAATDINIAATYEVDRNGYAIFGNGTLSGSGKIKGNGSAGASITAGGTAGTAGAGAVAATLPGGANGSAGAINASSTPADGAGSTGAPLWNPVGAGGTAGTSSPSPGGVGGTGGTCKGGGSGGRGKAFSVGGQPGRAGGSVGSINADSAFTHCMTSGRNLTGGLFGGSTGGAGAPSPDTYNDFSAPQGTDGGGGGGAGGWVVVCVRNSTFTGTIEAKGGAGGSGYSFNVGGASGGIGGPGAGGGAGGTIIFIMGAGTLPTFDVSGGVGGTGGTASGGTVDNLTAPNGGAGGVGKVISIDLSA